MERVIGEAFRSGDAELLKSGKSLRGLDKISKIRLLKIRVINRRLWRARQQCVRNTISEQFASVPRFAIAIRNAALKFACKQQSAQNSFLRAIAAHLL